MDRQKKYQLQDILFITLCVVIRRADSRVMVELFGKAKIAVNGNSVRRSLDTAWHGAQHYHGADHYT